MTRPAVKSALAVAILVATIAAFAVYFANNPDALQRLGQVPPFTLAVLFGLYVAFMAALIWIQRATLALCNIRLGKKENSLVVMYSSIINFFGPLQSGPAFRAAYLKQRHNINLKLYAAATLLYYGFYAMFSGILLGAFVLGYWVIPLCLIGLLAAPYLVRIGRFKMLSSNHVASLAMASLMQVFILSLIYFMQLRSLGSGASYLQAMTYTGAANFALFVSLTPGAIGFRESFLLFTQQAHQISSDVILTASLIDRSVYILLLLAMSVIVFGLHAGDVLKVSKNKS